MLKSRQQAVHDDCSRDVVIGGECLTPDRRNEGSCRDRDDLGIYISTVTQVCRCAGVLGFAHSPSSFPVERKVPARIKLNDGAIMPSLMRSSVLPQVGSHPASSRRVQDACPHRKSYPLVPGRGGPGNAVKSVVHGRPSLSRMDLFGGWPAPRRHSHPPVGRSQT
ncbi:hypothetical protein N657DRAFT_268794 [Parathielavia appendiculata]|uniref:Uncharacterized protein n=1 Tax=Parathielavia appendiculata TaxID=2587402 RepID=A0AAN6U394_9PEZI|nr:hypothetical protein N657DRAFT_268794 [Parathielavia appendiculata]